jgi:hypothetical protein
MLRRLKRLEKPGKRWCSRALRRRWRRLWSAYGMSVQCAAFVVGSGMYTMSIAMIFSAFPSCAFRGLLHTVSSLLDI